MNKDHNSIENLSAEQLSNQLKKPHGALAKEVGESMNQINKTLCLNAYKLLHAKNNDSILELGMCNGFFVKDLLATAQKLHYTGVDHSEDMINEAKSINALHIKSGQVTFTHASVEKLPYPDQTFDKVISINSIYFWPDAQKGIQELSRVLKQNGLILISYRSKDYLDQIDLANQNFTKFHPDDIQGILEKNGFNKVITTVIKEPKAEFRGQTFEKLGYHTFGHKH